MRDDVPACRLVGVSEELARISDNLVSDNDSKVKGLSQLKQLMHMTVKPLLP
jgi:hypothetical protein